MSDPLVPAEWNMSRAIPSLLHQGLVEFPAGTGMDSSPAIFTVILQTRHVSTEERGELAAAAGALTLVTQLIVQDIWLNFHLQQETRQVSLLQGRFWAPHHPLPVLQQDRQQLCRREFQNISKTQDFPLVPCDCGCSMPKTPGTSTLLLPPWSFKPPQRLLTISLTHAVTDLHLLLRHRLTPQPWELFLKPN